MKQRHKAFLLVLAGGVVDTTAPTVVITASAATITAAAFTATFTFSEDVTGFALGDITVVNGGAGTFNTVSPSVYTAVITPTATGTVTVDVAAGVCVDAAGNANTVSNTFSILYVSAAAWFDFSDITTLYQTQTTATPVTADGQSIGYAADKSGNSGRQAIQATAGARPTYKVNIQNGKSIARCDGGDALLTANFSLVQPALVFVVFNETTWVATKYVVDGVPDPNKMAIRSGSVDDGGASYNAGTPRTIANGMPKATWMLVAALFSGASSYYRKNGTQLDTGNVGTTAPNGVSIGSNPYLTAAMICDIAELMVFSTIPSDAARTAIESYFSTKWNLGF